MTPRKPTFGQLLYSINSGQGIPPDLRNSREFKPVEPAKPTEPEKVVAEEPGELNEGGVTRKHFRMVADLLKNIEDEGKRGEMAHHHAEIFSKQNPRFDRAKFFAASGVKEKSYARETSTIKLSPKTKSIT